MTNEQFLNEVLNSDNCPKNFIDLYSEFREYQALAFNTLKEFHRVCEKNNIPYQLAYGSLLGAIRDGGQIPWDYDVDVFVPYKEINNLISALSRDLSDEYYFYCPEVDSKCRHFMMRVTPKGFFSEALHVDVFYIIGVPEASESDYAREIYRMFRARYAKLVNKKIESRGRLKTYCHLLLDGFRYIYPPLTLLETRMMELCSKYDIDSSRYCISVDDESCKRKYLTKDILDTILITVGDDTFRVPRNYQSVLSDIYGNYLSVPSLNSRISELLYSYNNFKYYESLSRK